MPDNPAIQQLCSYENLYWAWKKVAVFCQYSDTWYDEREFRMFELELVSNLQGIAKDFSHGTYQTSPIKPLPQPKRSAEDQIETRQAFWISIRDQVAWLAYVNIVGPELDGLMPPWSYGNRLFRSITFQDIEGRTRMDVGPYRNSRGQTYRPWPQSWPLFRRHLLLTTRQMASAQFTLAEAEERILKTEEDLEPGWRLPYLEKGYWHKSISRVHWCSFDIAKFYPSVSLEYACKILVLRSLMAQAIGLDLLKQLSFFNMDLSSWTTQELEQMGLGGKETTCPFIPTGLSVAGFLANVAMLPVDEWVKKEVQNKQIAHFRYVDDHFILAGSFKSLTNWLSTYRSVLLRETGCKLKDEKTEPEFLRQYLKEECPKAKAMSATSLDPEFPTPLMTETLAKISDLSRLNFNLIDRDNQQRVLHDLHHLLVTEFPDEEVAQKTRIAFAATLIARLTPLLEDVDGELSRMIIRRAELTKLIGDAQKRLNSLRRRSKLHVLEREKFNLYNRELRTLSSRIGTFNQSLAESHERRNSRALNLLLRALTLHPEKLRLWERTLDFMRNTGKSAEHIRKHVVFMAEKNPLAAVLVRAKILQIICKHAFISVRVLSAGDLPLDARKNALHYLLSTARLAVDPLFEARTYYERISARFVDVAFSTVFDILQGLVATGGFSERERNEFRRISGQQRWVKAGPFSNDELWWIGRLLANISPKPNSPLVRGGNQQATV